MKYVLTTALAAIFTVACSAQPPTQAPALPKFGVAKFRKDAQIAQVPSPDAHNLAILFNGLTADSSKDGLGVAQLNEVIRFPVEGDGNVHLDLIARGNATIQEADCRLGLNTNAGGVSHWSDGSGDFTLTLSMDFKAPYALRLAIDGNCFAKDTEGSLAYLFVESLDLTLSQPDPVEPPKTKK